MLDFKDRIRRLWLKSSSVLAILVSTLCLLPVAFIILWQGLVYGSNYHGERLAILVKERLANYWPKNLQIKAIRLAWFKLLPVVYLDGVSFSGSSFESSNTLPCKITPGARLGVEFFSLGSLWFPRLAGGTIIIHDCHVSADKERLLNWLVGAKLATLETYNTKLDSEINAVTTASSKLNVKYQLWLQNWWRRGSLWLENSSLVLKDTKKTLVLGKVDGEFNNYGDQHQLSLKGWFKGAIFSGFIASKLKFVEPVALEPLRIGGKTQVYSYQLDLDQFKVLEDEYNQLLDLKISKAAIHKTKTAKKAQKDDKESLASKIALDRSGFSIDLNAGTINTSALPKPLKLRSIKGDFGWDAVRKLWRVQKLTLKDDYLEIKGQVALDWAGSMPESQCYSILTLNCKDISKLKNYLAYKLIPEEGENWLRQALTGGEITSGHLFLKGKLSNFPFKANGSEEYFKIRLMVKNGQLNFDKDWPRIDNVEARVVIDGPGLMVIANKGYLRNMPVKMVEAKIANLADPALEITAQASASLKSMVDVLEFSPFKERVASKLKLLALNGEGALGLKLLLPLWQTPMEVISVNGKLVVESAVSRLKPLNHLAITNLRGSVLFDENGVLNSLLDGLVANYYPIYLKLVPKADATLIQANTSLSWEVLNRIWPNSVLSWGSGNFPLNANIEVPNASDKVTCALDSDLKGAALDLPFALNKKASEKAQLTLKVASTSEDNLELSGDYANKLFWRLKFQDEKLNGKVVLGSSEEIKPIANNDLLHFKIKTNDIDLAKLFNWKQKMQDSSQKAAAKAKLLQHKFLTAKPASISKKKTDDLAAQHPWKRLLVEVDTEKLKVREAQLNSVRLKYDQDPVRTKVEFKTNFGDGEVVLPYKLSDTAELNCFFLDWAKFYQLSEEFDRLVSDSKEVNVKQRQTIDNELDTIFWLDHKQTIFKIAKLKLSDQESLEQVDVTLQHLTELSNHWHVFKVNQINCKWRDMAVYLTGKATLTPSYELCDFELDTAFNCDDWGEFLKQTGFSNYLFQGKGVISGNLNYQNHDVDHTTGFNFQYLSGNLKAKINNGAIVNLAHAASVSATLGKIINFFNITSLPKRLTLNFKDMSKSGLFFDQINASANLAKGALVVDDLKLASSSAYLNANGIANFISRHYDFKVTIMPEVTGSVPVVAALIGGPVVGVATLALERAASAVTHKVIKYDYNLTGDW